MTDGEIKECKERVLESLQDMPFILSNSLSGLDICLNAIPILLAFCNPNEMAIVKRFAWIMSEVLLNMEIQDLVI